MGGRRGREEGHVLSYKTLHNMQVSTFAGEVERSAAIRDGSFWIEVLFFDKIMDDIEMSMFACKMQGCNA